MPARRFWRLTRAERYAVYNARELGGFLLFESVGPGRFSATGVLYFVMSTPRCFGTLTSLVIEREYRA
jgi:hypothetical protein